tara:strand:- start:1217 stop:1465 length:249 start_codon:yes stop_codon:yes gene_type:complete
MPSILIMTIDTLINELELFKQVLGGEVEVELEHFTTTTTTATEEDLLEEAPVIENPKVKVILAEKDPGDIKLTTFKEPGWTW